MSAITPPPMTVRVHRAPERLTSGDEMDFTLWAGPVPLRWVARIENASPDGFTDRQVRGPFARWQHRHSFVRVSEAETDVVDEVEAELKRHPFWWVAGALTPALHRSPGASAWAGMPPLFAYRGWRGQLGAT